MKKKTYILILFIMHCIMMFAQKDSVNLQNYDSHNEERKFEIPTVKYDEESVVIACDSTIEFATILIKNNTGEVLYQENTSITPIAKQLEIGHEEQKEKSSIEVYYDDKFLYGYFQ